MGRKRKNSSTSFEVGQCSWNIQGSTCGIPEQRQFSHSTDEPPWFGRAISRKILAEYSKTPSTEDINFFQQIMEVTLKELYRARRARRNVIRPHTRPIFRSRYKDRLKQAYDYLIQRLQKKRQRVVRKIYMLQQRANQYNRGLPTVERFTINHPSCICSYCGASMWREESTAPTRNHPQPTFYLCCNGGKVWVAPT
ncbi:hypothetical protein LINPERHAP2_LOCUS5186, partial [Linum perenne]